jgi:hypothetical protein
MSAKLDHNDLSFQRALTTKCFLVETGAKGTLDVVWEVDRKNTTAEYGVYTGTFTYKPDGNVSARVKLSCYSIGMQGRRLSTEIRTPPTGLNVQAFKPDATGVGKWVNLSPDPTKYPITIPETSFDLAGGNKYPPKEERVWGISFESGSPQAPVPCVVSVKSNRILHSHMGYPKGSHDASPPPDEPGGQDGED